MNQPNGRVVPRNLGLRISHGFLIAAAAGLLWRLVRFGLHFEMTGDESNIVRTVTERNYADLLKPLDYYAVSPPGFLWLTKFMVSIFPSDWGARLLPFLAGFAAVGMFWLICREALRGSARWAAWAVFCVSNVPVLEGTRSKGYTIDLLLATLMLWWTLRWLREKDKIRYLACLALCAPVFLWISYTSAFIIGAAVLLWASSLLGPRLPSLNGNEPGPGPGRAAIVLGFVFMALAGASAIFLYLKNIRPALHVSGSDAVALDVYWKAGFPPVAQPWLIPWWLLTVHTGRGFAWPVGENNFASSLTFILWLTGLVVYWKRGNRSVWWLLVAAQGLSMTAGFLHKYPYLSNPRISMFLGPGICIFVGAGIQYLIDRARRQTRRNRYRFAALAMLLCAVGGITRDVVMRTREWNGPGIRGLLAETSRRLGPDGQFVVLNDAGISAVFTCYMTLGVPQKVWLNGQISPQATQSPKLAVVALGSRIAHQDYDALLRGFRERYGRPLKITWTQIAHEVLLDGKDEMSVWLCELTE